MSDVLQINSKGTGRLPLEDLILHFTGQERMNVAVSREMDLRWGVRKCFIFLPRSILIKTKGEEKNT